MQLHEQIAAVFKTTSWTIAEFVGKSGLPISRIQLGRKLDGRAPMRTIEAQVLADTLRRNGFEITLSWPSASPTTRQAA